MLATQNLSFSYGMVQALKDVTMTMPQGRVTCVMGRNGVGKTTLMKTMMGLLRQTSGSVILGDTDVSRLPANRRARSGLALVPQGRQIFPKLTVEENLRIGLEARPSGRRVIPADVYDLFPVLKSMSKRMGGDLSGGQQQQLAIARALVSDPKLLILDEPTEGIQPSIIKDIERVIRMLAQRGDMAILLVEQYYDFGMALADHYMVMSRGQVIKQGFGADMERDNIREFVAL